MTYLEWNKKLVDYYIDQHSKKEPFVLNSTKALLKELNNQLEDSYDNFIVAIKEGPIDNQNEKRFDSLFFKKDNIITKATRLKNWWRNRNDKYSQFIPNGSHCLIPRWNENYPPYLAILVFLVLEVDFNTDEKRYWESINKILTDSKVGSNDGLDLILLFEDFKKFIRESCNAEFYFSNVYRGGGKKYVGTIYSQLPLTTTEKENVCNFFRESGVEKNEIEQYGFDEIINLVCNSGQDYFEKNTLDILKQKENPILCLVIIEEIKKTIRNKEWAVDFEIVEGNAKKRIREKSELLITFNKNQQLFTLRLGSNQDFSKITFDNNYSVKKNGDYISENIKNEQNKTLIISDFKKIPKISFEHKALKCATGSFILLDYYEKGVYIQSKQQNYSEAYILVFKVSEEINKLIDNGQIKKVNTNNNSISNCELYKTNHYLYLRDLLECNPRITLESGAKKETGIYSRYWLPKVNFHYADKCVLTIVNIIENIECPESIDLMDFISSNISTDKIIIQLKKDDKIVAEKEIYIDLKNSIEDFCKNKPLVISKIEDKFSELQVFYKSLFFQLYNSTCVNYNLTQDEILIELSSVANKSGFIPSKRFSSILYKYLKVVLSSSEKKEFSNINYITDIRTPFVKFLQGFGYIKREFDARGNLKGVFISSPYILPVSKSNANSVYVLRGARSVEIVQKLLELKNEGKIMVLEFRRVDIFSIKSLNNFYPSEIYFSTPESENYVRTYSPRKVAKFLGVDYLDKAFEYELFESLPKSFKEIELNEWYGNVDIEKAIDNPLEIKTSESEPPIVLSYQTNTYLQPHYVVFDFEKNFVADINWSIFYVKAKHKLPIFYIGNSWDSNSKKFMPNRLYIKESEYIPDEIFNILCLENRVEPKLQAFSIHNYNGKKEYFPLQFFYEFEQLDSNLELVYKIIDRYQIAQSVIHIKNPKNNQSEIL